MTKDRFNEMFDSIMGDYVDNTSYQTSCIDDIIPEYNNQDKEMSLSDYDFAGDPEYDKLLSIYCGNEYLAKYWHIKHLGLENNNEIY